MIPENEAGNDLCAFFFVAIPQCHTGGVPFDVEIPDSYLGHFNTAPPMQSTTVLVKSTTVIIHNFFHVHVVCQLCLMVCTVTLLTSRPVPDLQFSVKHVLKASLRSKKGNESEGLYIQDMI